MNGLIRSSFSAWLRNMVVAEIGALPAFTGMRTVSRWSRSAPNAPGIRGHLDEIVAAADGDQANSDAVQADLDLVRIFHAAHQVEGIAPQPEL